jgi:pimeloyl-ACP methyl ester carboxylesterase
MNIKLAALAAAALASGSASAQPPEKPVTIVLVHGAFVDGSGWQDVYTRLTKDGYEVIVVQNSTATLDGDVATTAQAIARARHPVILVGHSYGGAVITVAGNNSKVKSLVYMAAFALDAGESVLTLISKPVPGAAEVPILPPQNGYLLLDPAKFPSSFAGDVDIVKTRFLAAAQVPWGQAAVSAKIDNPAWKVKPTYYLITTKDLMVPTAAQREMAKRANATTVDVDSSHAVMLSHPEDVVSFIEKAADASK